MAVRDSLLLSVLPTTTITSSLAGSALINLKGLVDAYLNFNCSAVPSGGTPTLDVYLQTTADDVSWQDIAHLRFATTVQSQYVQLGGESNALQNIIAASDAALPLGSVVQGPWGDQLRVKWVFSAGGSTGNYVLACTGYFK